jgi:hypothetical protein
MEQPKTNAGQGLGAAGLIFGILAIPLGILKCTFLLGLFFGVIGIVFGSVALSQAQKGNGTTGLPIGALSISIFGTCIALFWTIYIVSDKDNIKWYNLQKNVKKIDEFTKDVDNLEETFESFGEEMENVLEELEDSLDGDIDDKIEKSLEGLSDKEKAKKLGKAAGKALKEFVREVDDTSADDD